MGRSGPAPARSGTYYFLGWRFDSEDGRLSRDGTEVWLRPKTGGVLRLLVERPDHLVGKSEFLSGVWGDESFTGDDVLAVCINELRRTLGDDPRSPRFIATVHRRGYRFVAPVTAAPHRERSCDPEPIGRERELTTLRGWWQSRSTGVEVCSVGGEVGIGKTTLVRSFLDEIHAGGSALVAEGRCVAAFGGGEPYLPFLEILNELCQGLDGRRVRDVLWHRAPSWLMQLPGQVDDEEVAQLRERASGNSFGRMLRELADALDDLTAQTPALLVVEDLHDGDHETVELVSSLARSTTSSRVLLITTHRHGSRVRSSHSIADLRSALSANLDLDPLDPLSARRLAGRLLGPPAEPAILETVARRSGGNPLHLALLCEHARSRGLTSNRSGSLPPGMSGTDDDDDVPERLRQLITLRLESLDPPGRELLEAAAVAGEEFDAASVTAALAGGESHDADATHTEAGVVTRLAQLAEENGLLRELEPVVWPDGQLTGRFRFSNGLHRDVLYSRVPLASRAKAHRSIAERLARAFTERPGDAAASEIAMHFELGQDPVNAATWLLHAADTATQRQAPHAALELTGRALDLIHALAHAQGQASARATYVEPGIAGLVVRLHRIRITAVVHVHGMGSGAVEEEARAAQRAAELVDDPILHATAVLLRWTAALLRGDVRAAAGFLGALETASEADVDEGVRLRAYTARAVTLLVAGDPVSARRVLEAALALGTSARKLRTLSEDFAVLVLVLTALDDWLLGLPERARDHAQEALRLARTSSTHDGLCQALWPIAALHQLLGEPARVSVLAEEFRAAAEEVASPVWIAGAQIMEGWGRIERQPAAAVESIRAGIAHLDPMYRGIARPYHLLLLAEAEAAVGGLDAALRALEEALTIVEETGEEWLLPELLRVQAQVQLQRASGVDELSGRALKRSADELLRRSLDTARTQGARGFELRTLGSIAEHASPDPAVTGGRSPLPWGSHRGGDSTTEPRVR